MRWAAVEVMASLPKKEEVGVRKGAWTHEEDLLLQKCIEKFGEGKWSQVPRRAGLRRCRKSCRLRWLNYLRPDLKRGELAEEEVDLIMRLHKLLGNRWSLIAGRIPGRTANDIKNYWNSHARKKEKILQGNTSDKNTQNKSKEKANIATKSEGKAIASESTHTIFKPQSRTLRSGTHFLDEFRSSSNINGKCSPSQNLFQSEDQVSWWKNFLIGSDEDGHCFQNANSASNIVVEKNMVSKNLLEKGEFSVENTMENIDFSMGWEDLFKCACNFGCFEM